MIHMTQYRSAAIIALIIVFVTILTSERYDYFIRNLKSIHLVLGSDENANTMMASSNETCSRVTGPSCGEFTNHRWIPLTKGQ